LEIINPVQKEILNTFGSILDSEHFYLTGGTALAYFYLRHRKSNDLDLFTANEEIILPFSLRLEEALKSKGMDIRRLRGIRSFIELMVNKDNEATIIHLACDAAFRIEETRQSEDFPGLKIDSLPDLAANKLLALFGRATLRDFVDVYFLVKEAKFTPQELMAKAAIKDPGFDLYWLGVALERINTFKERSAEMLLLVKPIDFSEASRFFDQWRETIAKELL